MKAFGLIAGSALLLAACAGQQETTTPPGTISTINVTTDLQSIGNAESVRYWQSLDQDLEAALATEFLGSIDPQGALLTVDVDEIALANAYSAGFGGEDSRLAGQVALADPVTERITQVYTVSATSREAASMLSGADGVVTVSPDSDAFYEALVQAFARGVAQAVRQGS